MHECEVLNGKYYTVHAGGPNPQKLPLYWEVSRKSHRIEGDVSVVWIMEYQIIVHMQYILHKTLEEIFISHVMQALLIKSKLLIEPTIHDQ